MAERLHGWFSQMAVDAGCGSAIYIREDGSEVEVTVVDRDAAACAAVYHWPDKEYRGEVVRWVRTARRSVYSFPRPRDAEYPPLRDAFGEPPTESPFTRLHRAAACAVSAYRYDGPDRDERLRQAMYALATDLLALGYHPTRLNIEPHWDGECGEEVSRG